MPSTIQAMPARGASAQQPAAMQPCQQAEQDEGRRQHRLALHDVQRGRDEQRMQCPKPGTEQRRRISTRFVVLNAVKDQLFFCDVQRSESRSFASLKMTVGLVPSNRRPSAAAVRTAASH